MHRSNGLNDDTTSKLRSEDKDECDEYNEDDKNDEYECDKYDEYEYDDGAVSPSDGTSYTVSQSKTANVESNSMSNTVVSENSSHGSR